MKVGKNGPAAEMQLSELKLEKDTKLTKPTEEKCCSAFRPVQDMEEVAAWISKECSAINCIGCMRRCCNIEVLKKRLPILKWLPCYRFSDLRGDFIAGVTLGLTVIPQSLAYAKIAELPTQYGLYTSFMCYFAYCLFGTARDVNLGPTAVLSLLTAEFTHQIPQLAAMLALICGVAQIIMGILNIGFLVEFISHTIINSFTTAAALAIVFSQVKKWLGLSGIPRDFARQLYWTIAKIPETQWLDFTMGLICMIFLFLLKKLKTVKFENANLMATINFISTARNAITIFVASTVAAVLLHYDLEPFTLTGNITSGIPPFTPPSFFIDVGDNITLTPSQSFQKLGIGSVITPLVGLIEVIAIGKAFGKKNSYKVDADQEFFALGVSNILGSFVSAYPVTGSFSRSAVAAQSGIRTPAANVITGILVLLALAFLTPVFYYIPTPGLAAVIIMAVTDLVDFSMIKQLWIISKSDLIPWFATFFISLLFGFEYGILIGVAVSLLFLLHPWAKPDIQIYPLESIGIEVEGPQLKCDLPEDMIEPEENILIINLSLGLLFPGAENFEEKVLERANFESLIFDFSRVTQMDFSAASSLGHLASDLKKKNIRFVFLNVEKAIAEKLQKIKQGDFTVADSMEEAVILLKMMKKKAVEGDVKIFIDDDENGDQSKTMEGKTQPLEEEAKPQDDPESDKKPKKNENDWLLLK